MSDSSATNSQHEESPAPTLSKQSNDTPQYDSASLFQGRRVVVISHAGETYRLLLTRNNRLILQK